MESSSAAPRSHAPLPSHRGCPRPRHTRTLKRAGVLPYLLRQFSSRNTFVALWISPELSTARRSNPPAALTARTLGSMTQDLSAGTSSPQPVPGTPASTPPARTPTIKAPTTRTPDIETPATAASASQAKPTPDAPAQAASAQIEASGAARRRQRRRRRSRRAGMRPPRSPRHGGRRAGRASPGASRPRRGGASAVRNRVPAGTPASRRTRGRPRSAGSGSGRLPRCWRWCPCCSGSSQATAWS